MVYFILLHKTGLCSSGGLSVEMMMINIGLVLCMSVGYLFKHMTINFLLLCLPIFSCVSVEVGVLYVKLSTSPSVHIRTSTHVL